MSLELYHYSIEWNHKTWWKVTVWKTLRKDFFSVFYGWFVIFDLEEFCPRWFWLHHINFYVTLLRMNTNPCQPKFIDIILLYLIENTVFMSPIFQYVSVLESFKKRYVMKNSIEDAFPFSRLSVSWYYESKIVFTHFR